LPGVIARFSIGHSSGLIPCLFLSFAMLRTFLRSAFVGAAFALLVAGTASAQSARPLSVKSIKAVGEPTSVVVAHPAEAASGTFQLVRLTNKRTVAVTTEALAEIEQRRHQTDEVRWVVSPYAVIRILPRSVISAPGFVPVAPVADAY
jgi:hypothetical protein